MHRRIYPRLVRTSRERTKRRKAMETLERARPSPLPLGRERTKRRKAMETAVLISIFILVWPVGNALNAERQWRPGLPSLPTQICQGRERTKRRKAMETLADKPAAADLFTGSGTH